MMMRLFRKTLMKKNGYKVSTARNRPILFFEMTMPMFISSVLIAKNFSFTLCYLDENKLLFFETI